MSDYRTKLEDAIVSAHESGDIEGAQILAGELKMWQPKADKPTQPETSAGNRFIKGLRDPIDAGAQMLTNALPQGMVDAGNSLNNWMADKTGLVGKLPEGGVDQQVRDAEKSYGAPQGIDWARMAGNILSPANLAVASKLPVSASLGGRMLSGSGGGALMGAMQPVTQGDFVDEKTKQVLSGAALGGALPAVTGSLARLVSPKASVNPKLDLLKSEGVDPTIGQALGGRLGQAEEKLQSVPILGDMISRAKGKANNQFEAAAYNRVLAPIGQKLPDNLSGRDAVNFAEGAIKQQYDDVLNKIGAITTDNQFKTNIGNLKGMVNGLMMPKAEKSKFMSSLNDVQQSIDRNGVLTSEGYKTLESSLGTDARKLGSSQNIYEGKLAPAVKQLQQELKDMLKRQAGTNADELSKANSSWAQFKRVQRASSSLGAEDGAFSPAQLQSAVKAMDKSKDKGSFARGGALMQDLTDAGKSVLTGKVGNSFTTDRMLMGGGLGSALGYFIDPSVPLGLAAGAGLYTNPVQRALVSAVSSRPQSAQKAAELVRKSRPYLIPASMGLLNYQ